jgi:hypothetical protein
VQRFLIGIHLVLGFTLLVVVASILVLALPAALRGGPPPRVYLPLHRLAAALIGLQVLLGLALLGTGRRPGTALHPVYAIAALATMPAVRLMSRRIPGRGRLYQMGGTALLLGLLYRLATTG